MAALSTVLALPELMEHILLQVDEKTILLAQRVSKQWQATIASSVILQQKLFFRLSASHWTPKAATFNHFLLRELPTATYDAVEAVHHTWHFAIDLFSLPPYASALKMYVASIPVPTARYLEMPAKIDATGLDRRRRKRKHMGWESTRHLRERRERTSQARDQLSRAVYDENAALQADARDRSHRSGWSVGEVMQNTLGVYVRQINQRRGMA